MREIGIIEFREKEERYKFVDIEEYPYLISLSDSLEGKSAFLIKEELQ